MGEERFLTTPDDLSRKALLLLKATDHRDIATIQRILTEYLEPPGPTLLLSAMASVARGMTHHLADLTGQTFDQLVDSVSHRLGAHLN